MRPELRVISAGPGLTVQDLGRPGHLGEGLSRGGAADIMALHEGAALLGQAPDNAALEMAGYGGRFEVTAPARIALTGAPMAATLDGARLAWHASHPIAPGQVLEIGACSSGSYGYLHLGGGLATQTLLGARSIHLKGGLGAPVASGDALPLGLDTDPDHIGYRLPVDDRFSGGEIGILPTAQTGLFGDAECDRFTTTEFRRSPRASRQGVQVDFEGAPFAATGQLSILSEIIVPGDIQVTGDGTPYVLLPECQTTGGYPRLATVVPSDLPCVAQAPPGAALRFIFRDPNAALAAHRVWASSLSRLNQHVEPLVRNPSDIRDLLSYNLISGTIRGDEP